MPATLVTRQLAQIADRLCPGGRLVQARLLGGGGDLETARGIGHGDPFLLVVDDGGARRRFVIHAAGSDRLGPDQGARRADRAAAMLLAYDTNASVPRHVRALDIGAVMQDGSILSLRDSSELYLVTEHATGTLYADDLRRIARDGLLGERDRRRAEGLIRHLIAMHRRCAEPADYLRALRELLGDGGGIMAAVDSLPPGTPGAAPAFLHTIEHLCLDWRWRLRDRTARARVIHGNYQPAHILFADDDALHLASAARGSRGDPADDVASLAIHYLFAALGHTGAWHGVLAPLWHGAWRTYIDGSGDSELLSVAAPWFARRALTLANPRWHPAVDAVQRADLLGLAERALRSERFDPSWADELFA